MRGKEIALSQKKKRKERETRGRFRRLDEALPPDQIHAREGMAPLALRTGFAPFNI